MWNVHNATNPVRSSDSVEECEGVVEDETGEQ